MKKKYILLSALLFATLFPVTAGAQVFDHKTRKELERENNQLRKRLELQIILPGRNAKGVKPIQRWYRRH